LLVKIIQECISWESGKLVLKQSRLGMATEWRYLSIKQNWGSWDRPNRYRNASK